MQRQKTTFSHVILSRTDSQSGVAAISQFCKRKRASKPQRAPGRGKNSFVAARFHSPRLGGARGLNQGNENVPLRYRVPASAGRGITAKSTAALRSFL